MVDRRARCRMSWSVGAVAFTAVSLGWRYGATQPPSATSALSPALLPRRRHRIASLLPRAALNTGDTRRSDGQQQRRREADAAAEATTTGETSKTHEGAEPAGRRHRRQPQRRRSKSGRQRDVSDNSSGSGSGDGDYLCPLVLDARSRPSRAPHDVLNVYLLVCHALANEQCGAAAWAATQLLQRRRQRLPYQLDDRDALVARAARLDSNGAEALVAAARKLADHRHPLHTACTEVARMLAASADAPRRQAELSALLDELDAAGVTLPIKSAAGIVLALGRVDVAGAVAFLERYTLADARMCLHVANCVAEMSGREAKTWLSPAPLHLLGRVRTVMHRRGIAMTPHLLSVFVKGTARLSVAEQRPRAAQNVDRLLERECAVRRDVVAHNTIVDAYVRCGDVQRARAYVEQQRCRPRRHGDGEDDDARARETDGDFPSTRTYNTLLKGMLARSRCRASAPDAYASRDVARRNDDNDDENSGDGDDIVSVFRQVPSPNAVTYNTVLQALGQRRQWTLAQAILEEADGARDVRGGTNALARGIVALIDGLARHGRLHDALRLFDERMLPATTTVATSSSSSSSPSEPSPARELSGDERESLLVAYTALISACLAQERVARAWQLFRACLRQLMPPTAPSSPPSSLSLTSAYNAMITGLCRIEGGGHVDDALALREEMARRRVKRNAITYHALMTGLVRARRTREAERLAAQGMRVEMAPTVTSYAILLNGYSRELHRGGGDGDAALRNAWRLFREMLAAGLQPDRVTVNTFLRALSKAGGDKGGIGLALAERVFEQVFGGRVADKAPFAVVWAPAASSSSPSSSLWWGARMEPDAYSLTIMMAAYLRRGQADRAFAVYKSMSERGVAPDVVAFDTMIMATATRLQRPDIALAVLRDAERAYAASTAARKRSKERQGRASAAAAAAAATRITSGAGDDHARDAPRVPQDKLRAWREAVAGTVATVSEVWKRDDLGGAASTGDAAAGGDRQPRESRAREIFRQHQWNQVDSRARWWP